MTKDSQNIIELVDDLKITNQANTQLLQKALSDINLRLEEISDGDDLIAIRNTLAEFKRVLDSKFDNIAESFKELRETVEKDSDSGDDLELLENKFKSLFNIFDTSVKLLVTKVEDIESDFSKVSQVNMEITKEEFVKLSNNFKINQQEIVEAHKVYDENTIERFSFVAESIKLLSENINIQTGIYKEYLEKKTVEIQEIIDKKEVNLKEDNIQIVEQLENKFKEFEKTHNDFIAELDLVKVSVAQIMTKTEELPQITAQNFNLGVQNITEIAQDTLSEVRILQEFSNNVAKIINKISDYMDKNVNEDIFEAIKELDITQNISDLFDKINIFNNNFNIKTEFLETQILEMKTMFSEISLDIHNKEAEVLLRESERMQEYYEKIETVTTSILNLEENLKLSGVEYKEHIATLNKELTDFIGQFNIIYNEISNATQAEISASLNELKDFISISSTNYNDKLLLIQEEFAHAFKNLYEAIKNNDFTNMESAFDFSEVTQGQERLLRSIGEKIETITSEITLISTNKDLLEELNAKIDIIAEYNSSDILEEGILTNQNLLEELHSKVDELTTTADNEHLENEILANKKLLDELHSKLDIFIETNDSDTLEAELKEIKNIILERKEHFNNTGDGSFSELIVKIDNIAQTISSHDENTAKIKDDLVNTIVSVFNNSDFFEESEDIKDFVEEKTDEINQQLSDVKSQLEGIKQSDIADYAYTLSDVENDIANLRRAMNNLCAPSNGSSAEINQISKNIYNLTSSIDAISKNLTPAEIYQLKHNILKLNEDILSISSRTNKLLLNSDESQKIIADGLTSLNNVAFGLEEKMNELSNKEFYIETSNKLAKITTLLENATGMDATFHKVLMYLGEWVDAVSDTFENINDKTNEISDVSKMLTELRKSSPDKIDLCDFIEERFEEQQSRLDRLEAKIEDLTEITKLNSNLSIIHKVDKLEMMLNSLSANIEKLTSYVD